MSRSFAELWVHPKLDGSFKLGDDAEIYGALSVGATQTLGADPFDYQDEGAVRFGSAMLGVRGTAGSWGYDISADASRSRSHGDAAHSRLEQRYSWGGGASAQRKAWGRSLVARAGTGELSITAFALEPDEAPEARTDTACRVSRSSGRGRRSARRVSPGSPCHARKPSIPATWRHWTSSTTAAMGWTPGMAG